MENFKAGHLGKKHINCFVRRLGIRKKKLTLKKKARISSKGFELQIFEF